MVSAKFNERTIQWTQGKMNERLQRLSPRQKHILHAVICDYIVTAEPVGSRTLSKRYDFGLSPATIRNELSDLEEEGLLRQPHASAGRIPSDHGYRVFVDSLMERDPLPLEKQAELERMTLTVRDLPDLLQHTSRLTALLSGCTAIVRAPRKVGSRIKFLQLMPVAELEVLLILLTDQGQMTSQLVRLPSPIAPEELVVIANFLNDHLRDRPFDQLTLDSLLQVSSKAKVYGEVLASLWSRIKPAVDPDERVYVSHQSFLAQQPEFNEEGKVGQILSLLERDAEVVEMMDGMACNDSARVAIGTENKSPDLQECSLVTATYHLGDRALGEIAVIGPTRMHYSTAIAAVEAMAHRLGQALCELYGLNDSP